MTSTVLEPSNDNARKPAKKKRSSGSNKSRRKQREYQAHTHAMLASGYVNDERGTWVGTGSIKDGKVRDRAEKLAQRLGAKRR